MKNLLDWFRKPPSATPPAPHAPAPLVVEAAGAPPLRCDDILERRNRFPVADWDKVAAWHDAIGSNAAKPLAWAACERAWLLHLRDALGSGYRYDESGEAALISTLSSREAEATLQFVNKTRRRILTSMEGVARTADEGLDILLVLDSIETYYDYVSVYYPESGDFALSGGMHINEGCSHFVTRKDELRAIEPVIVHEMTHAMVTHLPLPLWLNEGMAVNMERSLTGKLLNTLYTPAEMHEKHLAFWGADEIQEFWRGKSFDRQDDGNLLSYDLAQILVDYFAGDWPTFRAFVLASHHSDGGDQAAREHLGVDLGAAAAHLFGQPAEGIAQWSPKPESWPSTQNEPVNPAHPFALRCKALESL